jgi:hypothetical protein
MVVNCRAMGYEAPRGLGTMWNQAAADLGLVIESPFELLLPSGGRVSAHLLVRNFGAPNGMLIVEGMDAINAYLDEVAECGYGFCVMREAELNHEYDRSSAIDMLSDWTWSGADADKPTWVLPPSE